MLLVQKWPFFDLLFSGNIAKENVVYDILERKNAFLGYKNKKFNKSKKWLFSKGVNPLFWSKNAHFFNFFFLGNIGQKNVVYDILERKNAFLDYKKKRTSKVKIIDIFPEGLNHGFGRKMAIMATSFFRQYRPGKCLLRYSRKNKRVSRL